LTWDCCAAAVVVVVVLLLLLLLRRWFCCAAFFSTWLRLATADHPVVLQQFLGSGTIYRILH
jgi:hypothetical protein